MTVKPNTENRNPHTLEIDLASSEAIARMINNEDLTVAQTVANSIPDIARGIEIISEGFMNGGRLFYFGAGTSGRLGVLDASECPPTFGVPYSLVQGVIAGGDKALRDAIEGAEDSQELAVEDFSRLNITPEDTVVAISAGGNAGYVIKILELAKERGCAGIALTCNPQAEMNRFASLVICVPTGSEVIAGSTRMKAGTAQKMVLNMLSTGAMIKIGKTYQNLMIDVAPTNAKLKLRAIRIVSEIAGVPEKEAEKELLTNQYKIKHAILSLKYGYSFSEADKILTEYHGRLREIFLSFGG